MQQSNLFNFSYWKTCRICTKDILDSDTGFLLLPILLGNIHHIFLIGVCLPITLYPHSGLLLLNCSNNS